jgi:peptide-methionine (S)-S-oxide reductase
VRTAVGYAGGTKPHPTYHSLGDHTESIRVVWDPKRLRYEQLLEMFFESHDPGRRPYSRQYMSALFPANAEQTRVANEALARWSEKRGKKLHTVVQPLDVFYLAEDYHQKYYLRSERALFRELAAYDERDFVDSTVAARLNAFAGGEATEELAAEIERYGVSAETANYLRGLIGRRAW